MRYSKFTVILLFTLCGGCGTAPTATVLDCRPPITVEITIPIICKLHNTPLLAVDCNTALTREKEQELEKIVYKQIMLMCSGRR